MKDKGFRQIDNEYYLAMMAADLTRSGSKVLLAVIHFTLGYDQRDTAEISHKTFQELTKLSRPAVKAAIRELISCNMIARVRQGSTDWQASVYRINTDISTWAGRVAGEPPEGKPTYPVTTSKQGKPTTPVNDENLPSTGQVATPTAETLKKERKPLKKVCDASITTGTANKYNNSQGDIPLKPPSKTTRKFSSNPYIAQLQEYLGFPGKTAVDPVPSPGREAKTIKRMLDRGFTWDEILAYWKGKVSQRGGDFVSMVWVNEDIGKSNYRKDKGKPSERKSKFDDGWPVR